MRYARRFYNWQRRRAKRQVGSKAQGNHQAQSKAGQEAAGHIPQEAACPSFNVHHF
jgi:hypothetical protein